MARRLQDICEELKPGSRKRNWPSWASETYREAMKRETEHYYAEQLGGSWTVRYKLNGEVFCFRPTLEAAVTAMQKAEAMAAPPATRKEPE